jgi:DNA-binding NtrC family response regulator
MSQNRSQAPAQPNQRTRPVAILEGFPPGAEEAAAASSSLRAAGLDVQICPTFDALLGEVQNSAAGLIVIDADENPDGALDKVRQLVELDSELPIVLSSARVHHEAAMEAIRNGAADYIEKARLDEKLHRRALECVEAFRNREVIDAKLTELAGLFQLEGILGRGPAMRQLFWQVRRIAPHFETLLLHGETGSGKELMARAVHNLGVGRDRPFVAVNCAAFTDSLFESEVFGYVRGAFTGADRDHAGLMEAAEGGTLFLDELGELTLPLQAKLLRAIQLREVRRLGSTQPVKVNLRVVAATNRNIQEMVARGEFREDLFYRLSSISLRIPPLRERRDDLGMLISHLLAKLCQRLKKPPLRITSAALTLLIRHNWPGNVRELESVLSYCCMTAENITISVRDLPPSLRENATPPKVDAVRFPTLAEVEAEHIARALSQTQGNLAAAARLLGISRATLQRHVSKKHIA